MCGNRRRRTWRSACTYELGRVPVRLVALRTAVLERYPAMTGLTPMVFAVDATDGAGRMA